MPFSSVSSSRSTSIGIGLEFLVKYNFAGNVQYLYRKYAFSRSNSQTTIGHGIGVKFNFPHQLILTGLKECPMKGIHIRNRRQAIGSDQSSPDENMANKGKIFFISGNYITNVNKNRSNELFF